MVLVIDVGNTNIVIGIYKDDELYYHWRINTHKQQTEDEYGLLMKGLFREQGVAPEDIEGIMISSVVPSLMMSLENMCTKYFGHTPLVVGPGIRTSLSIQYDNPKEVGADRIVNAVAALIEHEPPLIIIDFGTATTFCYINEQGVYAGGVITPGIHVSTEALYEHASKLPRIDLKWTNQVVGKNTVASMQSGILYGYVGQVDGIVKKIIEQTGSKSKVLATGGLAELIASHSEYIERVDPFLTLKGLYHIYKKNTSE